MGQYEEASLELLGNGEAIQKFNHELNQAIANCRDPNTDTKAVRKVVLEVKLTPDASRQKVGVTFQAKFIPAPDSAGEDHMVLTKDKAFVDTARQLLIEDYENDVREMNEQNEATSKEGTNEDK